jgi:hypothetical protein
VAQAASCAQAWRSTHSQRQDEAGALGHRDEITRRHQTMALVLPAHQRLGTHHAAIGADLRLIVQHELAFDQGDAQVGLEGIDGGHIGLHHVHGHVQRDQHDRVVAPGAEGPCIVRQVVALQQREAGAVQHTESCEKQQGHAIAQPRSVAAQHHESTCPQRQQDLVRRAGHVRRRGIEHQADHADHNEEGRQDQRGRGVGLLETGQDQASQARDDHQHLDGHHDPLRAQHEIHGPEPAGSDGDETPEQQHQFDAALVLGSQKGLPRRSSCWHGGGHWGTGLLEGGTAKNENPSKGHALCLEVKHGA